MTTYERLAVSDGTTEISLIRRQTGDPFHLNSWRPTIVQPKGGGVYQESALSDGRRLVDRHYDNAIESFDLKASDVDQNSLIYSVQELRRLLENAVAYWIVGWVEETAPVYLIAQASCETNARYAIIHNWNTPDDENPFAQPFLQPDGALFDSWTLNIERGDWLENPPGTGTAIQVNGQQTYYSGGATTDEPQANGDDVSADIDDQLFPIGNTLPMEEYRAVGIRFIGISTLASDSIVDEAYLQFEAAANDSGDVTFVIYGELDATPAGYTTLADFMARTLTTARREWTPEAWTAGNSYTTVDITDIINEIIALPGWAAGNDIAIQIHRYTGSGSREAYAYDDPAGTPPRLRIHFVDGTTTTYGRDDTTADEVFLSNRQMPSSLDIIKRYDDNLTSYSSNLLAAALPYDLLPATPAVDDACYFGAAGIINTRDGGAFNSLIFDLQTSMRSQNYSVVWEYYNGASWVELDVRDSSTATDAYLNETGVVSVWWDPPSDWDTVSVDGSLAYWVRMRVKAIWVAAGDPPTQQNRHIYTVTWASVKIPAAQVGGDLPALARILLSNRSYDTRATSGDLDAYRVLLATRSTSRGADFWPYLNFSYRRNALGIQADSVGGSFGVDPTAPAGERYTYGLGVMAWTEIFGFDFLTRIAYQYEGEYRVFLRAKQHSGSAGDVALRWKLYYNQIVIWESDEVYFDNNNVWQVLDFDRMSFPGVQITEDTASADIRLSLEAEVTNGTNNVYFYDAWLVPIDEWAADISPRSEQSADSLKFGRVLDISSLLQKHHDVTARLRYTWDDRITVPWRPVRNAPLVLRTNAEQRLWLFSMELASDGSSELRSPPHHGFSLQMERIQRYHSYRGSR